MKWEADDKSLNALLLTDHGESCRVCTRTFCAHHRRETAWGGVINGYCKADTAIAEINPESTTLAVHASVAERVRPRATAIA
jgi:hypothetical protein